MKIARSNRKVTKSDLKEYFIG